MACHACSYRALLGDLHGCVGQGEGVHCSKSTEQKAPQYANNARTNAVWRSVAVAAAHRLSLRFSNNPDIGP